MNIIERLAARGVTPEQALLDIERSPRYMQFIASDDGQELLAWLAQQTIEQREKPARERAGEEDD